MRSEQRREEGEEEEEEEEKEEEEEEERERVIEMKKKKKGSGIVEGVPLVWYLATVELPKISLSVHVPAPGTWLLVAHNRQVKKNNFCPTNNATLTNFLLSSDAEIFVNKHRPSMQIGAKRAKTCMQCVHIPTELPFCMPPLVVGQLSSSSSSPPPPTGSAAVCGACKADRWIT